MQTKIIFILLLIGIASFIASFAIWFWLYPKRKRFLDQLKEKFRLKYPKGILMLKKAEVKGLYRNHEIIISPFLWGGKLSISLKFSNPKDFLGFIRSKKPRIFLMEPLLKKEREELFTGNSIFDNQFEVRGKAVPEIQKILPSSIQERLIQLAEKETFEIQILHDVIFYISESRICDIDSAKSLLDLLIDIAENIKNS